MVFSVLLLVSVAYAALKDEFCWEEYENVAVHPVFDENSVALGMSDPVDNFDECLRQCGVKKTCIGVSWRHEGKEDHVNFNKCFFIKKNGGAMKEAPDFHTALKVRCEDKTCWEERVNWAYNKFNDNAAVETFFSPSSPVNGFQDCLDRCTHSDKCNAVTWREEDTEHDHYNKCWFLAKPAEGVKLDGMRSAKRVKCARDDAARDGSLVCGEGTMLDADTNACVAKNKPSAYCARGTTWAEGEGCVTTGESAADVSTYMTAGKIKGTKQSGKVKADNVADCIEVCVANGAVAWEFSAKKGKCACYSEVKSTKEMSFIGEI